VVQIFHRPLDRDESTPIGGTEDAHDPFFSPDGRWVGFFAGGNLKKVSLEGGPSITLCHVGASGPFGASWGRDESIVFATGSGGLQKISAAGGKPETLAEPQPEKGGYRWPEYVPNGKAVLFTLYRGSVESAGVAVLDLETGEERLLVEQGTNPQVAPTGHLAL